MYLRGKYSIGSCDFNEIYGEAFTKCFCAVFKAFGTEGHFAINNSERLISDNNKKGEHYCGYGAIPQLQQNRGRQKQAYADGICKGNNRFGKQ
jgi:hypothetical protein